MVRGVGKGQFRVTWAWNELTSGANGPDAGASAVAEPGGSSGGPPLDAEELEPFPEYDGFDFDSPREPLVSHVFTAPAISAKPELELAPPAPVAPVPEFPPSVALPATGAEPSRVLLGLLARIWLVRSSVNGSAALTPPGSATLPLASVEPAPALPAASVAEAVAAPPPAPSPPSPTTTTELATLPNARRWIVPPDADDRRPLGGVATFLVEFADFAHPPRAAPSNGHSAGASHQDARPVHCRHPAPEHPVSRDSCSLPRVGREGRAP